MLILRHKPKRWHLVLVVGAELLAVTLQALYEALWRDHPCPLPLAADLQKRGKGTLSRRRSC